METATLGVEIQGDGGEKVSVYGGGRDREKDRIRMNSKCKAGTKLFWLVDNMIVNVENLRNHLQNIEELKY